MSELENNAKIKGHLKSVIVQGGGTDDYRNLKNKPSINKVELDGELSLEDLGIDQDFLKSETDPVFSASASAGIKSTDITNWNNKSDFSGSYNDLTDKPTIPSKTSDLTNDSDFVSDSSYVHTDNNYTTSEKTKLANLENYDDTEIKADISSLQNNKQDTIDSSHKLSSDLVDDTNKTNKFVTSADLTKLSGIETGAEVNDIETISVNGVQQTITNKNVDITVPTVNYATSADIQALFEEASV